MQVKTECIVPKPIKLNCWKHHAGFIKTRVGLFRDERQIEDLLRILLKIGESQMDLYLGKLVPNAISEFVIKELKKNKLNEINSYKQWLYNEGKDYKLVELPDKSIWTLRLGIEAKRFIHIHPGRYSPHTKRVRASTLKTAICTLFFASINNNPSIDTMLINKIRKKYLNEPPVKVISPQHGLGKLLSIFADL